MTTYQYQRMVKVVDNNKLAADFFVDLPTAPGPDNRLILTGVTDDGNGAAPTDVPMGLLYLLVGWDGVPLARWTSGQLVDINPSYAPNPGMLVLTGIPGTTWRLIYKRVSGGGGNSRFNLWAEAAKLS